jgi:hypothetical protein
VPPFGVCSKTPSSNAPGHRVPVHSVALTLPMFLQDTGYS